MSSVRLGSLVRGFIPIPLNEIARFLRLTTQKPANLCKKNIAMINIYQSLVIFLTGD
jgi:hypothetical protein